MAINRYCIYRHIKSCGETFYIGIGNLKRPYEKKHRNNMWLKTIKKYPNYQIEILKISDNLEEIKELEQCLIDFYGRKCNNTGTLTNITLGGEGVFGLKHSDKSKLKMSLKRKGVSTWNKNKKLSEEHKLNLSKNSGKAKKVICIKTLKIWDSAIKCAKENNINVNTMRCMLNGTNKNYTTFKYLENHGN